ncbi:hypothetical protein [Cohnella thermotolerans]|uniref:hypothetical protein n=1 Tax=Cohnella thermotolerans TaxID=329858 RepID=UPI00047ADA73|nr:hypothetical protein [Cohnella thermotolerans]
MSTPIPQMKAPSGSVEPLARRTSKPSFLPFVLLWIVLIGAGVAGSVWYTGHLKQQIESELEKQTARQIEAVQADYTKQLEELKQNYQDEMTKLQSKVEALNELLTFNKDNASDKTDNSNKLYTQISELKKQLDELKKNLDVLK